MNVKKVQKIVSALMLTVMLITMVSAVSLATTPSEITADNTVTSSSITTAGQKIVGVLQVVGVVLSVIMLTVIGIKYLMGSAEEKADYKKSLMPYVIGAALVFTASIFAQAIYDFFNGWSAAA